MHFKWMILVVGFSLLSTPIGYATVDFQDHQVQTTHHSQERVDQRSSGTATLNAEVGMSYQGNQSFSGHSSWFSRTQVSSEIYGGFLASAESEIKFYLPPSFEECENTPKDQKPQPDLVLAEWKQPGVSRIEKREKRVFVFTMDHFSTGPTPGVIKFESLSWPGPNGGRLIDLKQKWYYEPPIGSEVRPQFFKGRYFDAVVDTVGEHILALRVEDESGACAVDALKFLVSANMPYQVPQLSRMALHQEFDLKELTAYLDQIKGRESWKHSQGEGVTIAVLDSGLNYNHPLIAHNVKVNKGEIPGNGVDDDQNGYVDDYTGYDFYHDDPYPFDDDGHGSEVTGFAASAIGLAPKARVLPVKVSAFGGFDTETLVSGIYYAVNAGAQIINVSLGTYEQLGSLAKAIEYARAANVLIVAASGNDGQRNHELYPATSPSDNVISVGSVNQNGSLAPYSNWGDFVDVAAPGGTMENVLKSLSRWSSNKSEISLFSIAPGTSVSAPFVSGLAAQILSINPGLSPKEVIEIIMSTGDHSPSLEGKVKSAKVINALNAVLAAKKLRPSSDVYKLQIALMRHCSNLPSNFADRRFGPATRAALKQFQASYGLTPDGIYGPNTADALNSPVTGACK